MGIKRFAAATLFFSALAIGVLASDPELLSDFAVPLGVDPSKINGSYFTSTILRNVPVNAGNFATVTPANVANFQALLGLGVSSALTQMPSGTINVPHSHPRASEVLYMIQGTLDVGLINSTNNFLFTQTLIKGDLFVFPKGMVHFQINWAGSKTAIALSGFSSSNPGRVSFPSALFGSGIDDDILEKAFGVSPDVIKQLKAAQGT